MLIIEVFGVKMFFFKVFVGIYKEVNVVINIMKIILKIKIFFFE